MSKVNERIETIFSHAVGLQQDGRFRSIIYCYGNMIYMINQDMTVLLRFPILQNETEFKHPISFFANDYDSKMLEEKDGKICFIQENSDYKRTKSCRVPATKKYNPKEIFNNIKIEKKNKIRLTKPLLSLLEDDLSHIEFSYDGELKIIQRNIFSGAIIKIEKKEAKGLLKEKDETENFPVIALRLNDFTTLFSFVEQADFYFSNNGYVYFKSALGKIRMDGVIGQCLYQEMKGESDAVGRKVKKIRRGK